jgi:nucleoside-diphosphate-sugar epimerase
MILITGASGFLGSAVANQAHGRGLPARGMVRASSDRSRLRLDEPSIVVADMAEVDSLARAVEGVEAVIHCAATTSTGTPDPERSRRVNVEGTRRLVEACQGAGTRRYVQISSQSALPDNPSSYGRTKFEADQIVRASELEWTILKPGLIYGPGPAAVFSKVVEFTEKFPVVPVLGNGRHKQRPVHVEDVAWAALRCLETPESVGREYDLGGAEAMEFNDMLRAILAARGRRKALLHIPLPVCMALARVLGLLMKDPPVTVDNVQGVRLAPDVDNKPAERDLGFRPRSFAEGLSEVFGGSAGR